MTKVSSKRLKPSIKAKLSKLNSSRSFKHSRFSRANLTIFTIIFAAIGCYFLFFSHAATLVGDINSDGTVDATDFSFLVSSFGQATTTCTTNASDTCDLNADGKVDFLDVSVLVSHWGQGIPKNTALPQISGATNQGSVLTATNGTWSGTTPTYTYQWRDCDSSGNNCTNISGATNSSYTLTATDVSHTIRVIVTATNIYSSASATSAQTAVIGTAQPLYTLPSDRTYDWNPGFNSAGGIPSASWTIYKTISPSGGDDTATIQAALDSCPTNGVVKLNAGVFHISGQGLSIERSSCTLRGIGPGPGNWGIGQTPSGTGGTYLVKSTGSNSPVVIIGPRSESRGTATNLTSDAVKGAKSVTVASASGLAAGNLVAVNSTTDTTISHWNTPSDANLGWFGEPNRPIGDVMEIASISGNTLTFTTPFPITQKVSQAAHLAPLQSVVKNSGIEGLYVSGGEGAGGGGGIHLWNCAHCWVKHVEDTWTLGASIVIEQSFAAEVRDSYFHDSQTGLYNGGSSYGIAIAAYTSNTLVENNISIRFNKDMLMEMAGGGNVIGYNYMDDGADSGGQWMETVLNSSHMTTPHYELFEGNEAANFDQDDRWGNSVDVTIFRNHLTGFNRDFLFGPFRAAGLTQWHWYQSFVGNTLGTPSHPQLTSYEVVNPPNKNGGVAWMLCWHNNDSADDGGKCLSTQLRDGNFDYVSGKVHWHGIGGSGVNNGLTPPANSTLPDSLYLSGKPAFFGNNTWPWVNGASATTPLPGQLPARTRYDAGTPNTVP
jgi:hypothetical protein